MNELMIHAIYLQKLHKFFLYGEEDGKIIPPSTYISLLFTWHESSFFGTNLKEDTFEGKTGLFLSAYEALELFEEETGNSFYEVFWSDQAEIFRLVAPTLKTIIEKKAFEPSFAAWKENELTYTLTDEGKQLTEQNILIRPHLSLIQTWLESTMQKLVEEKQYFLLEPIWPNPEKLTPAFFEDSLQDLYGEKEDWLLDIGWYKDETPFTIGLRISEPEEDGYEWTMQTILKDKKTDTQYVFGEDKLPAKFSKHKTAIQKAHRKWEFVTPTIFNKEKLNATISEEEAWDFLLTGSEKLIQMGVDIYLPSWWQAVKNSRPKVKARVTSTNQNSQSFVGLHSLVNFEWRFSTRNRELSEEEFLALVEQNRRLVRIQGEWMVLDPSFIQQIRKLMQQAEQNGISLEDVLKNNASDGSEADFQDDISDIQIEMSGEVKKLFHQLYEGKEYQQFDVPTSFQGELRPYQTHGAGWLTFLRKHGFGACLADDMGLGKTIQLIAYFLSAKEEALEKGNTIKPCLIICPTSVLGNWQKELEKFAPNLLVKLHYGPNRVKGEAFDSFVKGADVILTSYALSHLDEEELTNVHWDAICLDEAQNIKNADTKQSQSVRKLRGRHHIALTGTPIENRLSELWAIFDFINPGYLGSLGSFHRQFVVPVEREQNKEKIEQLQKLIQPFLLRRTKTDKQVALNLPDKQEQKEYCPLTIEQASIYERLVKETLEQVEKLAGIQRRGLVLKMLGQLKQVCDHPSLYLKEEDPTDLISRSSKMEKLVELVEEVRDRNESCLIFTQYIGMGNMIVHALQKKLGERVKFLHGSVSKKDRDTLIDDFQAGKYNVLVLSLKAGGTGLNLTAANHVIHYDRWWNPAVENQATDRAYRIGQKRFVHVHKFITTGTLEEKIDAMIESKQSLNDQIITSEGWITELTNEELQDLLVLRN